MIDGYIRTNDRGITTEVALLSTFAIGVLSVPHPDYSGAAAVIVTVLLAARPWLHEVVKSRITDQELTRRPVVARRRTDRPVVVAGPKRSTRGDVFNPHKMWVVVVLGQWRSIALGTPTPKAVLDRRRVACWAGVFGGLVSSVA